MTSKLQAAPAWLRATGETFRSLMVHVQPEAEAQPRLMSAIALAKAMEARLLGVGAEIAPVLVSGVPYALSGGGEAILELYNLVENNLKAAADLFAARAAGLNSVWLEARERPGLAVAQASSAADLIIAGGSPASARDTNRWCDPAELILRSGRPVLVVPPLGGALKAEAIVVAWKETREARRALADALPFLRGARQVTLLEVRTARDDAPGSATTVAASLKRHGVNATAKLALAPSEAIAEKLCSEASAIGADLIVAGGYGHSRLGEWVFGGATIELLKDADHFVLLSH